jgi:two-component system sensor histidine kinase BaeS
VIRSLAIKLTLAFLLVGLTGSILVAVITRSRTEAAFNTFILNQEQQALVDDLELYYHTYGTWVGVNTDIFFMQPGIIVQTGGGRGVFAGASPFTLVGPDQVVVYSNQPDEIGKTLSKSALNGAIQLQSDNQNIGWLLLTPIPRNFGANTPEANFLRNVNSATLVSASIAVVLALTLGGFLAFTMTRSLRELTDATVDISQGKFGNQVKVRSKDEIGRLAAAFNQMSAALDRATKTRRQMTADIAHDLRSPLSVITGYAEALNDKKLAGDDEVYSILLQETKHLDRLVDDLRLLSLADTGELPLTLQPTNPKVLLERMKARHTVVSEQYHVDLIIQADEDLPQVNVDVERMSQVLDNLILNAFRYTPQGGKVTMEAVARDGVVQIRVKDTGTGIAPEDLPHIFDRFYRGDKSRSHNGESGLGLAIAKSIVEAHGGKMQVESKPGEGAEFIISLNRYQPEKQ